MTSKPCQRPGHLILVRHGESEGNRDRTFTQHADVPLTAHGRVQVGAAAERIRTRYCATRIVASPFARALQTAEIIAGTLGLAVEIETALREQSFGIFAGRPYTALLQDAAYHEGPRWAWRPPAGESLVDVYERVVPAFDDIARTSAGRDVVIVSHGGVMLALCAYVLGSWEGLSVAPNAGIVAIEYRDGRHGAPLTIDDP
jgi:broad specificity phosphatase PhoE